MIAPNAVAVAPDLELDGWLERFEDEAASGHAPNPADFELQGAPSDKVAAQ